jgi:hypothetical protein
MSSINSLLLWTATIKYKSYCKLEGGKDMKRERRNHDKSWKLVKMWSFTKYLRIMNSKIIIFIYLIKIKYKILYYVHVYLKYIL